MMKKKRLRDIPIGRRLSYGYACILVFFFVAAILNMNGIRTIKNKYETFYNKSYVVSLATTDLRSSLNAIERDATQYVYNISDKETIKNEISNLVKQINSDIELISSSYLGDKKILKLCNKIMLQ